MALLILKEAGLTGGFVSVGTRKIKNVGWLLRHANEVSELHFKRGSIMPEGKYLLKAYMMNGNVFECVYNDRSIFALTFNRSRNLRGVIVHFDNDERQFVGELSAYPSDEYVDLNDKQITVGARIETDVASDDWMKGDSFGEVIALSPASKNVRIKLDKSGKKRWVYSAFCKLV